MKQILYCILLSVMAGCSPMLHPEDSTNDASRIFIECLDQEGLRQSIVLQLRTLKMKDIEVVDSGSFLDIKAAWYNKDISLDKVVRAANEITHMAGVMNVRLEGYKGMIRQAL